jgi:hypothetical protein
MHTCETQFDPIFDIVRVFTSGPIEDHHIAHCLEKTVDVLEQTQCQRVLVDYRDAQLMLSPTQSDARFAQFAANLAISRRVALIYKSLGVRQKQFRERALESGLAVDIFTSEWQALDWLLEAATRI